MSDTELGENEIINIKTVSLDMLQCYYRSKSCLTLQRNIAFAKRIDKKGHPV